MQQETAVYSRIKQCACLMCGCGDVLGMPVTVMLPRLTSMRWKATIGIGLWLTPLVLLVLCGKQTTDPGSALRSLLPGDLQCLEYQGIFAF